MKKKSFSLQKLPDIYKIKKDKFVQKNQLFQQQLQPIEKLNAHNELMSFKIKPYETARPLARENQQHRVTKIISLITNQERFTGNLQPIKQKQIKFVHTKELSKLSQRLKTPGKKMNVDGYIKQRDDKLIEQDLKDLEVQNHRRLYLPSIVESEKKLLPFFNQQTKQYEDEPFVKLEEAEDKVKIRFLNGFEKWVPKSSLKKVEQNQKLSLESYRKIIKKLQPPQQSEEEKQRKKEIIEKINIDNIFLEKMLSQVFNKKNPRTQIKHILREQLYGNYEDSVKSFNTMFVEQREFKKINRFQKKNAVSKQIKELIDHNLVCSYDLDFLGTYMLSKNNYIHIMVQAYNIVRELSIFSHFDLLRTINNTSAYTQSNILLGELSKYFSDQKYKVEGIIFRLEEHLNMLLEVIRKDIEHIIFLNPRLVGSAYQQSLKIFITSCISILTLVSEHLSKIIRSVLIQAINQQLIELAKFYTCISGSQRHIWLRILPQTSFYQHLCTLNRPFLRQNSQQRITHGPGLIPIVFTIKKWKRKKYNNIFRFIIESRQKIRSFSVENWRDHIGQQQRIVYRDPQGILKQLIQNPLHEYFTNLSQSENVNGCILNKKIDLFQFLNLRQFLGQMTCHYNKQNEQKLKMYATYFELWQLYLMEKSYIDQFIQLYKRIKTTKLIEQEMKYLQDDLDLIKSFPNIVEIQMIRLDISQVKDKIESTIVGFMKKLLKVCEEYVAQTLEFGHNQTIKVRELSQLTPYSNLAEYIEFINFLNRRQVQKSIAKIAQSVVFIDLNIKLLQKYHFQLSAPIRHRYLECGIWIKRIRAAALQNKKKVVVDPYSFLKGVKDKKTKIFLKYNKMLKEIIELMKVNELKNSLRLSITSDNIAQQMKQICIFVDQIIKEEILLELQHYPGPDNVNQGNIYRSDLTFFYKEEKFLKKYLSFWVYAARMKNIVDNAGEKMVLQFEGADFVRFLRQGQEMVSATKLSTLNKRFLHLCDEVLKQLDPYLKSTRLFLFAMVGPEKYRLKVLKSLSGQRIGEESNKDFHQLKVKEVMSWPWMHCDWPEIYKIHRQGHIYESMTAKLNSIELIIKNIDLTLVRLQGVGDMRSFDILKVDEEMLNICHYCTQLVKVIEKDYGSIIRENEQDEDILCDTSKKLAIFIRTLTKMKIAYERLPKYYSLFQLLLGGLSGNFQDLNLPHYGLIFTSVITDYCKRSDLVKKLTLTTILNQKTKLSYDQQLNKLQQFQLKLYRQVLNKMLQTNKHFGYSPLEKQHIYQALQHLALPDINVYALKLMGNWCQRVRFEIEYHGIYCLVLKEFQTVYQEKVKCDFRAPLVHFNTYFHKEAQQIDVSCGLLDIVQQVNRQLQNKIKSQTFMVLTLIYEFHYSVKHLFQFYLFVNNLLFQPIIYALILVFYMDLGMVWENKYDLNLLGNVIRQGKIYTPKERQNMIYVQSLTRILQSFLGIIELLQEKEYGLDDNQRGRIKKMFAFNSIPKIYLDDWNDTDNKIWISDLKQVKEDDIITNTHLNPELTKYSFLHLDPNRIESREIQKKDIIMHLFDSELNIRSLLVNEKDGLLFSSHAEHHYKFKVTSNIAPHLGLPNYSYDLKYQLTTPPSAYHYSTVSFRATALLLESHSLQKVFVTNIHPNYLLLGQNFTKVTTFITEFMNNLAIIVSSEAELLAAVRSIIRSERQKQPGFVYVYFDRLKYNKIKVEDIEESCIVFQHGLKMQVNNLLKRQLNFNQKQLFESFMQSEKDFSRCIPWISSSKLLNGQKMITPSSLRIGFDAKQRQHAMNLIYQYEEKQGFRAEVSQTKLTFLSSPVLILTKYNFLETYYHDMAVSVYSQAKRQQPSDKITNLLSDVVNEMLVMQDSLLLSIYCLPVYNLNLEELLTNIKDKQIQIKWADKYKKDLIYRKVQVKPIIQVGIINQLIQSLHDRMGVPARWERFRIKGQPNARVKWFVIDLRQESTICEYIFLYLMQSYNSNEYVFANGVSFTTEFHSQRQKLLKDHTHKLIIVANPSLLSRYQKDLPPVPILNEIETFDPIKEFNFSLNNLKASFDPKFTELINFPQIVKTFRQVLALINIQNITVNSMKLMSSLFYIIVNEVRKREIAFGHYSESNLSTEESKGNLMGAVDLREKTKLMHQQALQLQEIQKKMDTNRRQIYKAFIQNTKWEQLLTLQTQNNLAKEYDALNPPLHNPVDINLFLQKSVIFTFYYSQVLLNPQLAQSLSSGLISLTGCPNLSLYCLNIQDGQWQRWQEVDTDLTEQSCSSDSYSKVLSSKEIIRLHGYSPKLQPLRNYVQDVESSKQNDEKIIKLKGAEIYFTKLMILYEMPLEIELPEEIYPRWAFEYELGLMSRTPVDKPLRAIPQGCSKKLHKLLLQSQINTRYVKLIDTADSQQIAKQSFMINFKIAKDQHGWFKTTNSTVIFIRQNNKQKQILKQTPSIYKLNFPQITTLKVAVTPTSTSPFTLLTTIHGANRFNDLQSSLSTVLISLKTYMHPYLYHENYRFREYRFKGLDSIQRQEVFGLGLRVTSLQLYNQNRKRIKEVIAKIRLQQMLVENKQQLKEQQLQRIKHFDRIQELNYCLSHILQAVEVQRKELTIHYALRFMLKRPKKYEKIQHLDQSAIRKKRSKSPTKHQFDDILLYNQAYDRNNLIDERLNQVMIFFALKEKVLMVQHEGEYTNQIKQKYILGYKFFKKALQTMQVNKNTKPFALDPSKIHTTDVNINELPIYSVQSIADLQRQFQNGYKSQQLVIVTLFNPSLFAKVVDVLYRWVILEKKAKDTYCFLFVMRNQQWRDHGYRCIIQRNEVQLPNEAYLRSIKNEKIERLMVNLQKLIFARAKTMIEESNIGKAYISLTIQKLQEIKAHTAHITTQLLSKRQIYDKIRYQIDQCLRNLQEYKGTITDGEKSLKEMQRQLGFWRLKKSHYIGDHRIKDLNDELKTYNRKKLEKQINHGEYLEENPNNISYIYVFNILADNNYFADKSTPLFQMQYEKGKNYILPEQQKKQFQKLINYGRLNALIDNHQVVFEDLLITQEHLTMADKVRWQFVYLRGVRSKIFEEREYSEGKVFSLDEIVSEQCQFIRQKHAYQGCRMFNRYILYLFTHKYIKMIVSKKISDLEGGIKKTKEAIAKSKEKIEHEELKLSSGRTYLEQIQGKYQIHQKELQNCKNNQKKFTDFANKNITTISRLYLRRMLGLDIVYRYDIAKKLANDEKNKTKGKKKERKERRILQEEQAETNKQKQGEQEGTIQEIADKETLFRLSKYIVQQMATFEERRQLSQNQCQLILSLLARANINSIIEQTHLQTLKELYQNILIYLLRTTLQPYLKIFNSNSKHLQQIANQMDPRNYNILDLTITYRSKTHYFCSELESAYSIEVTTLLDRLQLKKDIVDGNLLKLAEKVSYINAKSSESINKFELGPEVINAIEEANSNALKQLTNTPTETMYYAGQWSQKNKEKYKQYSQIVQEVEEIMLSSGLTITRDKVIYYLKIIGMICKKVGLAKRRAVVAQLIYDHSSFKNDSEKQIVQKLLQKQLLKMEEVSTNSYSLSRVSTLDSILVTNCRLVLVQGDSKTVEILQAKAQKQSKILKRKDTLQFYVEEHKSKEYWIVMAVKLYSALGDLIDQLIKLNGQVELSDEIHMKFIVFFQGESWKQKDLTTIQEKLQPIYRYHYSNSATSVYYHTYHIERHKMLSTITKNRQIAAISDLMLYFYPPTQHIPFFHIDYTSLTHPQIITLVQNIAQICSISPHSIESKLFSLLVNEFKTIKTSLSDHLNNIDKQAKRYLPLLQQQDYFENIRTVVIGQKIKIQRHVEQWVIKMDIAIEDKVEDLHKQQEKVALSDMMRLQKQQDSQDIKNSEEILCDPYKFLGVNKIFNKLISKLVSLRDKNKHAKINTPLQKQKNNEVKIHTEGVQISNKYELFHEFFCQSSSRGMRINGLMGDLSQKEKSGSVGIHLCIKGSSQAWLQQIFRTQLYLSVVDKPHKNPAETGYIKGIYLRYSQAVIWVKKQPSGQIGQEEATVLKPLPQYKTLLPIYSSNYQPLGTLLMTTNNPIDNHVCIVVRVGRITDLR